jgi:cytidylate kinase
MSIITISRGSYSNGKEVAEKVAQELGYECVSRDIILEASEEFNVPEIKLIRAIHDAPSILERFTGGKKKFIAYFRAALLEHFQKDNVVYHGLAGHFLVMGISHVLKVRILAEMEDRVKLEMEREGIPKRTALQILKSDDEERRKWSRHLCGIDTWDPTLYDMVFHIKKLTCDDVASLICRAARWEHFRTTPESQQAMDDLTISARVKAALIDLKPDVEVLTENGIAHIRAKSSQVGDDSHIRRLAERVPGVKGVEIGTREIALTH